MISNHMIRKTQEGVPDRKSFVQDKITLVYSMYDRYMVGGAMPVEKALNLESAEDLEGFLFS